MLRPHPGSQPPAQQYQQYRPCAASYDSARGASGERWHLLEWPRWHRKRPAEPWPGNGSAIPSPHVQPSTRHEPRRPGIALPPLVTSQTPQVNARGRWPNDPRRSRSNSAHNQHRKCRRCSGRPGTNTRFPADVPSRCLDLRQCLSSGSVAQSSANRLMEATHVVLEPTEQKLLIIEYSGPTLDDEQVLFIEHLAIDQLKRTILVGLRLFVLGRLPRQHRTDNQRSMRAGKTPTWLM